jgi:hypothetical protein
LRVIEKVPRKQLRERFAAGRLLNKNLEWEVIGDNIADISENELEIWYSEQDRFAVSVRPPWQGADWIGPIKPGDRKPSAKESEFLEHLQ